MSLLDVLGFAFPAWMDDALCAQVGVEPWFPESGESPLDAMRICRDCPVRVQCLETALAHNEEYGIWAGMNPNRRKKLRKERAA